MQWLIFQVVISSEGIDPLSTSPDTYVPSPVLTPSNLLVIRNTMAPPPDKQTATPADRFILFGDSWLQMQTVVASALALPISQGDFTANYGDFSDKRKIDGLLTAFQNLVDLSGEFGDPSTIQRKIASDGSYLTSSTPPMELYGHVIWLALQIENAASTFTATFKTLNDILNPSVGTAAERASYLRALLTGPGGLASTAATMRSHVSELLRKMAAFALKVDDAAAEVEQYTSNDSKILADANKLLGQLKSDLDTLRSLADEAMQKWRDYTISAVTTSVGITIISAGMLWPVGAALGVGLGVAAAKERQAYDSLISQIAGKEVEVQKKTQLVTDLTGLNAEMPEMVASLSNFKSGLQTIEGVWVDIGGNLNYIATNYTDDQLANLVFVIQIAKILDAQRKWQNISDTAQQFTQHSLVSYSRSSFGTPLS
jgi:hypothetical protein